MCYGVIRIPPGCPREQASHGGVTDEWWEKAGESNVDFINFKIYQQ